MNKAPKSLLLKVLLPTIFAICCVAVVATAKDPSNASLSSELRALPYEQIRMAGENEQWTQMIEILRGTKDEVLSLQDRGLKYLTMGYANFRLGQWDRANENLEISLRTQTRLEAYVRFLQGQVAAAKANSKKATESFQAAFNLNPNQTLRNESLFALGKIAFQEKSWNSAAFFLNPLLKRWKNTQRYPEVLYMLVLVELERGRRWNACKIARNLYAQYPANPMVSHWGFELQSAKVEGRTLGCLASAGDIKKRIRRLQLYGEESKAKKEIEEMRKRAGSAKDYFVENLNAQYLIQQGAVDEALRLLFLKYDDHNSEFNYLMLLAQAAARAGQSQLAVGSYYKAYQLQPGGARGKRALYQAAFLSYQFQDYDGAHRKFKEFVKRYPKSTLARESLWHMAWIRYLKGDYLGAVRGIEASGTLSNSRSRRARKTNWSQERSKYWMGMSFLKLQNYKKAGEMFQSLILKSPMSYYGLAAQARFKTIPKAVSATLVKEESELKDGKESGIAVAEAQDQEKDSLGVVDDPNAPKDEEGEASAEGEGDSEVASQDTELSESSDDSSGSDASSVQIEGGGPQEETASQEFSSPQLQLRFDRARDLLLVGFNDWARGELQEMEGRTRNPVYLRKIIKAYETTQTFYRSSYIGLTYFGIDRQPAMTSDRYLWEASFPRAYERIVRNNATKFAVNTELIWSIMKAESQFRPQIVSPVGAQGLMQIMPYTGKNIAKLLGDNTFVTTKLVDPELNIKYAARYLQRLLQSFDGDQSLVAAAYNAGPHRVESWLASFGHLDRDEFIEHIPFVETRNYVKKVLRYLYVYAKLYTPSPKDMDWLSQPLAEHINATHQAQEDWTP